MDLIIVGGTEHNISCAGSTNGKPWSPDAGDKFRVTNTRWTGVWLILSLVDKDGRNHYVQFTSRDTQRLMDAAPDLGVNGCAGRRSANNLLGHWLRVTEEGVVMEQSSTPSLNYGD